MNVRYLIIIAALLVGASTAQAQNYGLYQQQMQNLDFQMQYQRNMDMLNNMNAQLQQNSQRQQQQMLNMISPRYCFGMACR